MNLKFAGIALVTIGAAYSQTYVPSPSAFDIALIKPNASAADNMGAFAQPGGRFGARNVHLQFLIGTAYNVKDYQIVSGAFSWINRDRYDITAKAPEGTANGFEAMRPMLQSLLADRFKLVFHREIRELPVYELGAAKSGLKLAAPKDGNCTIPDPTIPRPREDFPFCDNIRTGRGLIAAYGITMPRLIAVLSNALGRMVIYKAGFTRIFDAHLEFNPDEMSGGVAAGQVGTAGDSASPSIFTALQEQLGLRADSAKGPVEVLVIDHAERPSEN